MGRGNRIGSMAAMITAVVLTVVTPLGAQDEIEITLPVTINEVPQGETPVIIDGEDFFVPIATLERGGPTGVSWHRVQTVARLRNAERLIEGAPAISLRSLAPWATFRFDEANLVLAIAIDPSLLSATAVTVRDARPAGLVYSSDQSTFLNYSLNSFGFREPGGFAEIGSSVGGNLLYTSVSSSPGLGLVRGLTNYTMHQRDQLRVLTFGDAPVFGDELGGSGIIGGATIRRSFELDPYFIRFPSMSLRGIAETPSQVEVYVNGVLVDRRTVPPGPFEIGNVTGASGTSNTTVVVRDAFGREQTQSSSFYYSTGVLTRGLSEYIYSAGAVRDPSGSFDYGESVAFAMHRYGLTDHVTIGGRIEGTDSLVSGGPSVAYASRLGEIDLKLAGSSSDGSQGVAGILGFRRLTRRTNFGGAIRLRSRDYANFSLDVEQDRPLEDTTLFASYLPSWGNLALQWTSARMRDTGERRRLALISNVRLGNRASLLMSAAAVEEQNVRFGEYFVGISLRVPGDATANVSMHSRDGVETVSSEVQRSLPVGTGWGYRVQSVTGDAGTVSGAAVQYQNDFGRYEIGVDPERPGDALLSAAGGLVYQAGRLTLTRPVAQSFALVRVPGVGGVRVYLSNQLVGRTDGRGDLLVPNLLPYYGNRIRIDDRDVPMTHDVQIVEQTIAPPSRGGALVVFPAKEIRAAVGTVVIRTPAGDLVPAYGELRLLREGTLANASPIGGVGEFYFENVAPGSHEAEVIHEGGSCRFSFTIPSTSGDLIDVGQVVCSGVSP